jgi:hypothetical protein
MTAPLDFAIDYATRLGWAVFPVKANKRPACSHGFRDASADPDKVRALFAKSPGEGVGVDCGDSALVVVDVDNPASFETWRAGRELPATVVATTPRGRHLFFRQPELAIIKCSAGTLAPGIDIRAAGGYIILPSGNGRKWERDPFEHPIAELPAWLIGELAPAAPASPPPIARTNNGGNMLAIVGGAVEPGSRNASLTCLGGLLRAKGVDGELLGGLLAGVNARFSQPLPSTEVMAVARSVARYPASAAAGMMQPVNVLAAGWPLDELRCSWALDAAPEPFTYVVPGFLPAGIFGVVFGEGGGIKTQACLWLAVARAAQTVTPTKWLCHFDVTPGRTLYLAAEDVRQDMHHRLHGIRDAVLNPRDMTRPDAAAFDAALRENLLIATRELLFGCGDCEPLIDADGMPTTKYYTVLATLRASGADLLIVDTRSRVSHAEENDNGVTAREVEAWTRIRDETGCTVLLVTHASKAGRNGLLSSAQSVARGASSLIDNARWALWFQPTGFDAGGRVVTVTHAKSTRTALVEPFKVMVRWPALEYVGAVGANDTRLGDNVELAVAIVEKQPGISQRAAWRALDTEHGLTERQARSAVDAARAAGRLRLGKKDGLNVL